MDLFEISFVWGVTSCGQFITGVENRLLPCVERRHGHLLKYNAKPTSKNGCRTILANLTVPGKSDTHNCASLNSKSNSNWNHELYRLTDVFVTVGIPRMRSNVDVVKDIY